MFSSKPDADPGWVIQCYKDKNCVEEMFGNLKDPDLIRIRPLRHWTDTKIQAYIFSCVMAYTVLQLMVLKVEKAGLKMSPNLLKEELSDLHEVVMIYENDAAERRITNRSTVQQKLYNLFELEKIEKAVNVHYS